MTTVQNIGATDYQMPINQQEQLPAMENYATEPEVYDPIMEEKKEASSSMKGLAALGVALGVGGVIYGVMKNRAAKNYEKSARALEQEVANLKQEVKDNKGIVNYIKKSWPFKMVWTWSLKPIGKGIGKLFSRTKKAADAAKEA